MLDVEVYTVEGKVLNEKASLAVVPGLDGDIGISSSERLLVYLIKPGVLYLFNDNKLTGRYFLFNGRFIAKDNSLVITTEYKITNLSTISNQEIEAAIKSTTVSLETASDSKDKHYYQSLLEYHQCLKMFYNEKSLY